MVYRSLEDFEREFAGIRKQLAEAGYHVEDVTDAGGLEAGIQCDFDLPYSTLPRLDVQKWRKREIIPAR